MINSFKLTNRNLILNFICSSVFKKILLFVLFIEVFLFFSCKSKKPKSDAYGNFEAIETIVSSEVQGKIIAFKYDEGQQLKEGDLIAVIDSTQLYLTKMQLMANKNAISAQLSSIVSQINVQEEQKSVLVIEKNRIDKLILDGAATIKQLDDINGKIRVIDQQIKSIRSQNSTIINQAEALQKQIELTAYQLEKCKIINPIQGTMLEKYIEKFEIVVPGKALYKIANLDELILRVYIDGSQLSMIKIGQEVTVRIDKNEKENNELSGVISWISSKAEFTPKIIQTKEERVNLVYAIKIKVKNDGSIKIGMPGEVVFVKK